MSPLKGRAFDPEFEKSDELFGELCQEIDDIENLEPCAILYGIWQNAIILLIEYGFTTEELIAQVGRSAAAHESQGKA